MCFTKYSGGKGSCACCFCRIKKQFTILVSTLVKYLKALVSSVYTSVHQENVILGKYKSSLCYVPVYKTVLV